MPTYDYACAACGHRFEVIHGVHGEGPAACPQCGHSPVRKAVVAPTFVFKGSGWAKLDRRVSPASTKATEDSSTDTPKKADESGADKTPATAKAETDSGAAGTRRDAGTKPDKGSTAAATKSDSGSSRAAATSD